MWVANVLLMQQVVNIVLLVKKKLMGEGCRRATAHCQRGSGPFAPSLFMVATSRRRCSWSLLLTNGHRKRNIEAKHGFREGERREEIN